MSKRILSFLLAAVMLVLAIPAMALTAFAADNATATMTSTLNGLNAASNTANIDYQDERLRFFQWYDANDNEVNAGGTLTTDCYAKLNPEMVAAAGIDLANDTYAQAYAKYLDLLLTANVLTMQDSNWSVGNMGTSSGSSAASFRPITYPVIHVGKNLGLVESGGVVGYPNAPVASASVDRTKAYLGTDYAYFVTKDVFDSSYNSLKTGYASYVTDESVKAGTVTFKYNANMAGVASVSSVRSAHAHIPMDKFQMQPRSSAYGDGAYRYTAPKDGTVTFSIDGFDAAFGGTMTWTVAINRVRQGTAATINWQTPAELEAYKTAVAGMSVDVNAGDTVEFLYGALGSNGGFRPTITATLTYDPAQWTVEGQLKIDSNYSVSVIATPNNADGVMSAVVGGKTVPGVKRADGSYEMVVKSDIFITALTSEVVSYQLQETANGQTVTGAARTLDVNALLATYENHSVAEVAQLAQDIRRLADYANYKLGNASEPSNRTQMKYSLEDLKAVSRDYTFSGDAGEFKIIGANVNYDDALRLVLLVDAANGGEAKWKLFEQSGYAMKAYNGQTALNLETSEFGSIEVNGQKYVAIMVDVPVAYWNQQIRFVVEHNGVAVSRSLNYSHNTWCSYLLKKNLKADGESFYSDGYIALGVYNVGRSAAAYLEYVANNA